MRRMFFVLIFVIFCTAIVNANDDAGNVNDPAENDRANACYEDGSLAGKCDTDWEWTCGWYLIRFEYGSISREEFPGGCASLLPPIIEDEPDTALPSGPGCQLFTGSYVLFTGNFLAAGATTYSDATCLTPSGITLVPSVYAPGGVAAATVICNNHGFAFGGLLSGDVYHCI